VTTADIANTILKTRLNQLHISPGYDGEYGRLLLEGMSNKNEVLDYVPPPLQKETTRQLSLDEFK